MSRKTGKYSSKLRVETLEDRALLSATVLEVEPNNGKSQATAFTFPEDGLVQLQGTSTSKKDKDFFRFTVPATGPVTINVTSPNGRRVQVEIEDRNENDVFETEPNDGINGGTVTLQAGKTYYLRARSKSDFAASYLVDLALGTTGGGGGGGGGGGSVVSESENNDRKSGANQFAFDDAGKAQLIGTSQNKDDKDFFVFTATKSGTVSVVVNTTNGRFAQLEVETATADVFETEPNDGVNSGSFNVVAGQRYFVRMRSKADAPAAYQVDLTLS